MLAIQTRVNSASLVRRDRKTQPLEYWTHVIGWFTVILITASAIVSHVTGTSLTDLWAAPIGFFVP